MYQSVENGDFIGCCCYMNSHTLSESNNQNFVYSTKKMDENVPNTSEM